MLDAGFTDIIIQSLSIKNKGRKVTLSPLIPRNFYEPGGYFPVISVAVNIARSHFFPALFLKYATAL